MLFGALSAIKPISMHIMSEIPTDPAGTGSAVGNGVQGAGLDFPGLKKQDDQTGDPSSATPAPKNGQPSPQGANTVIDDAAFYILNKNDPKGSRTVGLQLREAVQRGRQVDQLQSERHTWENENQALKEQRVADQARIRVLETEAAVREQMAQAGVGVAPQNPAPVVPQNQQGVLTPQGTLQPDPWSYEDGTPGAYGYTPQPPVPQGNVQQPVPQPQNTASPDPQGIAQQLRSIQDQLAAIPNIEELVRQSTQAGFQQLQQERAVQDQVSGTLQANRQVRAEALHRLNVDPAEATNILDLEDMAAVFERASEDLLAAGDQNSLAGAQKKLRDADLMRTQAIEKRTQAQMAFQSGEEQRQFEQNFETAPFAAAGVEEQEVDYNLTKPQDITAANRANAQNAVDMAVARARIENTTGH